MKPVTSIPCNYKCWVPNCEKSTNNKKEMFNLPDNPKFREIWLALAGKAITSPREEIIFCSEHFSVSFHTRK